MPEGSYRVQRGDTLYSIAFRNNFDFRELAAANGIASPYTIYVGQVIQLRTRPVRESARQEVAAQNPKPAPAPNREKPVASVAAGQPPQAVAKPEPVPALPPGAPVTADTSVSAPTPAKPAPPVAVAPPSSSNVAVAPGQWTWPAQGPRISGFVVGDPTRQGIDIAGKAGDPVRSTADGEVVYSGNGLIGYGELIIVKHSASMLSAYGHNRRRLVQEGDKVKAGQQIAEMGSTSASRDMLHFEIRRNGKPVDPLGFLPIR